MTAKLLKKKSFGLDGMGQSKNLKEFGAANQ
jgi:hypothetical protein